jgi:hypothetical protein
VHKHTEEKQRESFQTETKMLGSIPKSISREKRINYNLWCGNNKSHRKGRVPIKFIYNKCSQTIKAEYDFDAFQV